MTTTTSIRQQIPTTVGIEVEVKVEPKALAIYESSIRQELQSQHPDLHFGNDFNDYIEVRSGKLSIEANHHEIMDRMRRAVCESMRGLNLKYSYYGFHFSVFNFAPPDITRKQASVKEVFPELIDRPCYEVLMHRDPRNVYVDPFIEEECGHAIVPMRPSSLLFDDRTYNLASMMAVGRFFKLCPNVIYRYGFIPVPGISIRFMKPSRIEFVAGWMPIQEEIDLISLAIESVNTFNERRSPTPDNCFFIRSTKGRSGICCGPIGNQAEPRIPSMDPLLTGDLVKFFGSI